MVIKAVHSDAIFAFFIIFRIYLIHNAYPFEAINFCIPSAGRAIIKLIKKLILVASESQSNDLSTG